MRRLTILTCKYILFASAASVALGASASALAQVASDQTASSGGESGEFDGHDDTGEIVVTANRREEALSKVPISIAAYSPETMDRLGVRSMEDIANLTPGVRFSGSSGDGSVSIRGVTAGFGSATTAIYIDDTPVQAHAKGYAAYGSSFPQVFDLERVEVLRGPQGTLFGGSAMGGAVRFITPEPSITQFSVYGRGEVAFTEHGGTSYEAGVAVGGPIIEDKLGFRVSAWGRHSAGYVDHSPFNLAEPDLPTTEDANSSNVRAFRAALAFQPTENITLTPSVFYQRVKIANGDGFWADLSDPSEGEFVSGNAVRATSTDRYVLPSFKAEIDLGGTTLTSVSTMFDRNVDGIDDVTQLGVTLYTYNLNQIFPDSPRYFTAFLPGQQAPAFQKTSQRIYTQEVRLSSNQPDSRLNWTIGAFYSRARQVESVYSEDLYAEQVFGIPLEFIFGIGLTDGRYIFTTDINSLEKEAAIFGQVDYDLTDQLTIVAGLRYTKMTLDFVQVNGGPLNYDPDLGTPTQTFIGSQSSKPLTPKIGLNFQADPDNLFYISASKGFRGGGVNEPLFAGCTDLEIPTDFGPDTTWNYEIGSKNRLFGGALRIEQSIYMVKWSGIQTQVTPGGACAGAGFRDNLGEATSRGFDLQVTARLSDNLQLSGAVGYIKSTYDKTIVAGGRIVNRKGDTLAVTPWQAFAAADYTLPVWGDGEIYAHGDVRYNSRNNGSRANLEDPTAVGFDPTLTPNPAYAEVNLRLGLRKADVDLSAYVSNLFDKAPLLGKSHSIQDSPLFFYNTIRPRTVGVTATYRY